MNAEKYKHLEALSTEAGIIDALAIDQRGSLKKMLAASSPDGEKTGYDIIKFKTTISEELTPFASAILLDPEYGLPAAKARAKNAGLLMSYEKTGYDTTQPGRFPDLLEDWSVRRLKEIGVDAVKFLLYYDADESEEINNRKRAFIERVGAEADEYNLPFFLELVSYDANMDDVKGEKYAKVKPHKVIELTKEFSQPKYRVTVLKVEVPVNMAFVEGYTDTGVLPVYTRTEALGYFKAQSDATNLPFIFLSAGVTNELFLKELQFAKEAGSTFNGVLCGRATWKPGVTPFAKDGVQAGREWMKTEGKKNIERLNEVLAKTATSWKEKVRQ
ncbi:tagatose 1,6-diphosphate aldolase [Loigolactobacillus coryniformis]|uniref:Tagatose 1,6-diphosphate aldolase n=1 Tax=Loigolactobacillus coryniformis subsp. coryniformis CECT 5711 TaxID=1185325 RepID=J2Z3S1_9LACO|nr:tagatose 1,6-diphosphate aldolase [Loigolactobacillus coryniformis]EJN55093.1 Tagatose 1,6-diphosphate aldolase 1 [Loigolactobacillus coryniformis subsp. coryniformis CECT 5711]